jgi:hypothetical protein
MKNLPKDLSKGLEALNKIKNKHFTRNRLTIEQMYPCSCEIIENELKALEIIKSHLIVYEKRDYDGKKIALGIESKDTQATLHIHISNEECDLLSEVLKDE